MCGLVGIMSHDSLGPEAITLFNRLLHADTFRGPHSTGVLGVREDLKAMIFKQPVDGPTFVEKKSYNNWLDRGKFRVLMGHNRWATHGEVNQVNAHPFMEDNFVGMHNGTLHSHKNLEKALKKKYEVDSAAMMAYLSLKRDNMSEAFGEFNGSYAVTGYDMVDKELVFARNTQRPLAMEVVRIKGKIAIVYASERKMLDWLLDRHNFVQRLHNQDMVEMSNGTLFRYPLKGKVDLIPEAQEIPTRSNIWTGHKAHTPSNSSGKFVQPSLAPSMKQKARKLGFTRFTQDEKPLVIFRPLSWESYGTMKPAGTRDFGKIHCRLLMEPGVKGPLKMYVQSATKEDFDKMSTGKMYRAVVNTLYSAEHGLDKGSLTVSLRLMDVIENKDPVPLPENEIVTKPEKKGDNLQLKFGHRYFNEKDWVDSRVTCAQCDHPVDFWEAFTTPGHFRNYNTYICGLCSDEEEVE